MRVIAGQYKGRKLKTPAWEGLRPTSDKLRETLFNVLAPRISLARVFDGFAGTGAVGIEALSRGAKHVTFVDSDQRAVALIQANLDVCGIRDGYTIKRGEVATALRAETEPFDLIVLDPPYGASDLSAALTAATDRIDDEGLVVLERATRRDPPVPNGLQRTRDIKSGDSTLTFFRKASRKGVV